MNIQLKMGLMLIIVTTLTLCGFGVYQYQNLKSERMAWLTNLSSQVTDRLGDSLVRPLWLLDKDLVEKIIRSEMADPNIAAILVHDYQKRIFSGMKRDGDWKIIPVLEEIPGDYISKGRNIVQEDEELGNLTVHITPRFVLKKIRDSIQTIAITVVILDVVLFFVLSFGLRKMIVGPVNQILRTADAISIGDFTHEVEIRQQDEIGKLADAFRRILNSMRETADAAEAVAAGNLKLEVVERSENDRLMQALNRMILRLKEITDETNGMIQAVGMGMLDIRGNADAFGGGWRELVEGVNDLINGLSESVSKSAALGHEMELARKIQTSLLPNSTENLHEDFEIAAAMIPADQVGGDFYDIVFDRQGNLWLAIGDVSGHGVTPGLIMMMAQTVHTTMTNGIECDARSAVVMTNRILYKNVKERLGETHFMTFTALKYLGGGRFQYAGAHLSMVVFRKETATCELIKTRGIYLNFKKDISRGTKNAEFLLNQGDILVLYTDGLTEAETPAGEMLDIGGFVKIVEKHAHQDPEAMKDMILADVIQWCDDKRADDMTIVVVKHRKEKIDE